VVQSLDRQVPKYCRGRARSRPKVLASWTWLAEETQGDEGAAKLQKGQMDVSPVLVAGVLRVGWGTCRRTRFSQGRAS
jgi:hypothetical protein